jgi:hypothetical protein
MVLKLRIISPYLSLPIAASDGFELIAGTGNSRQ